VDDGSDVDPLNPLACQDLDGDACDDCSVVQPPDTANDGTDTDGDTQCDASDPDDDNDGYSDADETANCGDPSDPLNAGSTPADADGDFLCDPLDNCPSAANPGQENGDGDGAGTACDCDDADPLRFPGNTEVCDRIDNDCDGSLPLAEQDVDADGITACEGDCDDGDPLRFPGNPEVCDRIDNDCDGSLPAEEQDGDADNVSTCEGDCDDGDPLRFPGNPELCDGIDNDCDGSLPPIETDADGDGLNGCVDNCPDDPNPGQEDDDGDEFGDACDPCAADPYNDPDADGLCAAVDNCPLHPNADQADADGDGVGDACRFVRVEGTGGPFYIASTEVTNQQYADFLNGVAADDPNLLFQAKMGTDAEGGIEQIGSAGSFTYATRPTMGYKPVNFITWLSALRYVNWLANGKPYGPQGPATTEQGAYDLTIPDPGFNAVREPGARWFLPTKAEWDDAAYLHPTDPACCDYPTNSNTVPAGALATSVGDVANPGLNVANYGKFADWNGKDGNVTTVGGAGPLSIGPWGTWEQGGNAYEWVETLSPDPDGDRRELRGGGFKSNTTNLHRNGFKDKEFNRADKEFGLRVAGSAACDDADGDGFGTAPSPGCAGGLVLDCDDADPANYPGNAEVCDGFDNDCDGDVDEGTPDFDGDGQCDDVDSDDDDDGVNDGSDADPVNRFVCQDLDGDSCDDCANVQPPNVGNDGSDNDGDGQCDAGDPDDDNDGILDGDDCSPLNPDVSAPPIGIGDSLRVELDAEMVSWVSGPQNGQSRVFRGLQGALEAFSSNQVCLGEVTEDLYSDTALPSNGEVFFYVVSNQNECGSSGTGSQSDGQDRAEPDNCP